MKLCRDYISQFGDQIDSGNEGAFFDLANLRGPGNVLRTTPFRDFQIKVVIGF
jgi:hypothetical protein